MKPVQLARKGAVTLLNGVCAEAQPTAILSNWWQGKRQCAVVFCEHPRTLQPMAAQFAFLLEHLPCVPKKWRSAQVLVLPEDQDSSHSTDELDAQRRFDADCDRLRVWTELQRRNASPISRRAPVLIVTTPRALMQPAPAAPAIERAALRLQQGADYDFSALRDKLLELDYDCEAVCEYPGQFAVRGGLIDVYPFHGDAPVRLDFFGDELESIREFDPTTQRGERQLTQVVLSARPAQVQQRLETFGSLEYFPEPVFWCLQEPAALHQAYLPYFEIPQTTVAARFTFADLVGVRREPYADLWLALQDVAIGQPWLLADEDKELTTGNLDIYIDNASQAHHAMAEDPDAQRNFLLQVLTAHARRRGCDCLLVVNNDGERHRMEHLLRGHPEPEVGRVLAERLRVGPLVCGFFDESINLVVATARELLGHERKQPHTANRRRRPTVSQVDHLLNFAELVEGDHLVHLGHGICIYRGTTRIENRGRAQDVIAVEFADKVVVYVPLLDAHLLTRYVGLSKQNPKLGKIGSNQWEKTRRAAESATLDFAAHMLRLEAERKRQPGFAFSKDAAWQQEFEAAFPYRETPDQMRAIVECKADMERPEAMDRLICGDVGFGKTEVALRAAFKAAMDGKQVAILAPTTILAQQHLNVFRERFATFPVTVDMLSRFRNPRQQKQTLAALASGALDVIVGTHRLLSKDVVFKDLGLLVIDEEHRFGVRHKDRLKQLRANIDVLTMSATPIPRTLYMALMGARHLSVIETPPVDRLPIQTIVKSYDPELVKSAIQHELNRGGQVFYLHNRVETIHAVAARIADLAPHARVAVGHGQMEENELEHVMSRFVAGESDILVCTTIIENGLDIPNCNTIIIEGADRFGLSQLYQLRGRVGRFNRQAYAYLLLHRHAWLLDQARKRLSAMRQYNQLGAGFKIAMRDLELRGAGNLLGPQQSGHVAGVGFDLYCQLLRQSVAALKGEPAAIRIRAKVNLDFISLGEGLESAAGETPFGFNSLRAAEIDPYRLDPVEACLPVSYIVETQLRLDMYRRLAMAESLKQVEQTDRDLRDRFGRYPPPVQRLLAVTRIRIRAEIAGCSLIETEGNRLKCLRASGKRDDFIKLGERFPRLTGKSPDLRLREIEQFLTRQSP